MGAPAAPGAEGEAVSLVCIDEEGFLSDIEKLIKRSIPREVVPGYEPDPHARPEPIQLGRRVLHGAPGSRSGGGGGGRPGSGQNRGGQQAPRNKSGGFSGQNHGGGGGQGGPRQAAASGSYKPAQPQEIRRRSDAANNEPVASNPAPRRVRG